MYEIVHWVVQHFLPVCTIVLFTFSVGFLLGQNEILFCSGTRSVRDTWRLGVIRYSTHIPGSSYLAKKTTRLYFQRMRCHRDIIFLRKFTHTVIRDSQYDLFKKFVSCDCQESSHKELRKRWLIYCVTLHLFVTPISFDIYHLQYD